MCQIKVDYKKTLIVILGIVMLNVIMLNVVMLNVIMLNVTMLNVAAPFARQDELKNQT